MLKKLTDKMSKMTWKDWLQVTLWSLVLVMLLAVVITAATVTKSNDHVDTINQSTIYVQVSASDSATDATSGFADIKTHHSDLFLTDATTDGGKIGDMKSTYVAYIRGNPIIVPVYATPDVANMRDIAGVWTLVQPFDIPSHDVFKSDALESYANAVALVSLLMGLSLFGAITATVVLKYMDKKGAK